MCLIHLSTCSTCTWKLNITYHACTHATTHNLTFSECPMRNQRRLERNEGLLCGKCAVWKGRKESLSLGPADRDADGDMRGREVAGLKSRAWLKDEEDENGMGWIWDREVGEMIEDEKEEGVKAVNSVEDDEWRLKRFEQLKDEGEMIGEAEIEVDESDYDGYDDYDEFDDISSEGTENVAWGEYQRRSA